MDSSLESDAALSRYSRHILLPQVDIDGQTQLLASHVMIVGLGGLGSIVSQYLAASGVGHLTLVDHDRVSLSNLQRQIVHDMASIDTLKVDSAKARLLAINPEVKIDTIAAPYDPQHLNELKAQQPVNLLVDCTDNHAATTLLNRSAVGANIPLIIGSAVGFYGQKMLIDPRQPQTPCYECLHRGRRVDDEKCGQMGVISPLLGVIGSLQAMDALKTLLDLPTQTGQWLQYDALAREENAGTFEQIRVRYWADCPLPH